MFGSRSSASSGPEAEELVEDVDDQRLALGQAERRRLVAALDDLEDDAADLGLRLLLAHLRQPLEVQAVQQIVVDPGLQVLVAAAAGGPTGRADTRSERTTGFMSN